MSKLVNKMPLVSIIVPIYNSENKIDKCIKSILNQTYKNLEVILVNDGSTDKSEIICKKYASKDKRIKYVYKKNGGSSSARNKGIEVSTGEYIVFVDSDDYIDKQMISYLIEKQSEHDVDFVISGVRYVNADNVKELSNIEGYENQKEKIGSCVMELVKNERINGPVAKIYKTKIIKENNIRMPENVHLCEDLNFNIDYIKHINSIYIGKEVYYNYIKNNDSVTSRYYQNRYEMLNIVNDNVISFFEKQDLTKEELGEIYFLYVKNVYSSILNLFHKDCQLTKKEKKQSIEKIIKSKAHKIKINKAYKKGLKFELLLFILKKQNVNLIYYFALILNVLRNKRIFKYQKR